MIILDGWSDEDARAIVACLYSGGSDTEGERAAEGGEPSSGGYGVWVSDATVDGSGGRP